MTEQEAINGLNLLFSEHELNLPCTDSLEILNIAIKALEEIQQYRAIGTVEELEQGRKYMKLAKKHGTVGRVIDVCADYEEIGTVEECQEAIEELRAAKEDIRKLLCSEYGSSCQFCIQNEDEDAMCCNIGGSGSWCCENAMWKNHRLE